MKKEVIRAWSLILQIGLSVIVPIFIMIAIGIFLKEKFNTDLLLVFIIIGLITGIRNAYLILKNYISMMDKNLESEMLKKHKNILENKK